jgi:septation ring formation regulator EzrA
VLLVGLFVTFAVICDIRGTYAGYSTSSSVEIQQLQAELARNLQEQRRPGLPADSLTELQTREREILRLLDQLRRKSATKRVKSAGSMA